MTGWCLVKDYFCRILFTPVLALANLDLKTRSEEHIFLKVATKTNQGLLRKPFENFPKLKIVGPG